ncbi:MAG: imidazole glycerol phosphate synthase subunit HisH [Fidelibacterota bacterium]|nr:MAG: imidazole glycerol phosphate synthase subunit HisH [Candidatus Neomarinimicrobiota bacterium]
MIGLVDYGVGNIGSLGNALGYLGLQYTYSADRSELDACQRLILPGVGAFGPARECLRQLRLDEFLREWCASGRPLLGICLGMQLLLSESTEHGPHTGLDLIPGQVVKIRGARRDVHMGWNRVIPSGEDPFIPEAGYGYFVHSYHCAPTDGTTVIAHTAYGETLAAAIRQENILAVQFHPEKSWKYGLNILRRFADGAF